MKKVLVMGLSGAGKSTFSSMLVDRLPKSHHLNADEVRRIYNDWDFSIDGRIRQCMRMVDISNHLKVDYVVYDFICPLPETRSIIGADYIIWIDTIKDCVYKDTLGLFVPPEVYDIRIVSMNDMETVSNYTVRQLLHET